MGPPARTRFHRPACLGRGLSSRRRLDRPRSDLGPPDRRKPYPARRDAAFIATPHRFQAWSSLPTSISSSTCASSGSPSIRASPSLLRGLEGARRPGRGGRQEAHSPTMCGSPWAASRPSPRLTIPNRENGTRAPSARPSARSPTGSSGDLRAIVSRRAGSCITGRANGIPGKPCRAGLFRSIGGATASRSGRTQSASRRRGEDERREQREG